MEAVANRLREKYRELSDLGMKKLDLDSHALAGYYLEEYKENPIHALNSDLESDRVSSVVGFVTKTILECVEEG